MRKNVFGRQLKRDVDERKALFKGLMSSLVLNERMETTEAKAKAIKAEIDKLVTKAKKDDVLARRLLSTKLTPLAMDKMIKDIATRFDKRQGGYTKTVRLGKRFGDDSTMVLIEWTESAKPVEVSEAKAAKPVAKKAVTVKTKKPVKKVTPKNKKEIKK